MPVTTTNSLYPKGTTKTMARKNGDNYVGVLYEFGFCDDDYEWIDYSESHEINGEGATLREPDIVSYYGVKIGDKIEPFGEYYTLLW